jgi:hypothetical protein
MTARRNRLGTTAAAIQAEARQDGGTQCPKCKTWNLKHRRMCAKCGKRVKPSASMIKQEAERIASAAPDARSVGRAVEVDGRKFVITKGKANDDRR